MGGSTEEGEGEAEMEELELFTLFTMIKYYEICCVRVCIIIRRLWFVMFVVEFIITSPSPTPTRPVRM